jgi:hypothetical protein
MPIAPVDRKILLVASGVFIVMIGVAVLLIRGTDSSANVPSVYSAGSGGCKAAFLLLQESGYQTQTWEQPLADLSADGKGKTLIIVDPTEFPAHEEQQKLESFLKSGGQLIAAGRFANFYLPRNGAVSDPLSGTTSKRVPAISLSPITRAAPEITLASQAYWTPGTGAVGLYGESEKPVVVEYKFGEGRVLWLSGTTPLTNSGISEPGNLEFLLTALGGSGETLVLWDEYIHGHERFAAIRKSEGMIGWIGLQLSVFAVAILLAYARRSGPIWVPRGEVRLSPLEYVRTLGMLYEHANAGSVAVEISCQRFRYLLTRRLGLSVNTSVPDLALAVHERRGLPEQEFANTLSECESYRYDPKVAAKTALRLVQTLFDYAVRLKLEQTPQGEKTAWKQS